jgi:flavodoxin
MLSINLRADIENRFINVVQENYNGNLQNAIASFLKLQEKYGWKEQLFEDVTTIRAEVRRKGGISSAAIDEAIKKYRNHQGESNYTAGRGLQPRP